MVPTDFVPLIKKNSGIVAIIGGSLLDNLFGPSIIGWGLVLFGLGLEWVWPNRNLKRIPILWNLIVIAIFGLLSLWVTADFAMTAPPVNRLLVSIISFWAIACWLNTHHHFELFGFGLIAFGAVLAFAAPFIIEFQKSKSGFIPDSVYQQFPLVLSNPVHPNIMATIVLMLFPFGLLYALGQLYQKKNLKFWFAAIGSAMMLAILLLTRSRGGYVVGAVGVVLILALLSYKRLALLSGIFTVAVFILLVVVNPSPTETAVSALTDTNTVSFRLQVWELALNIIRDFPITGAGMGTFNIVGERLYPFPPFVDQGAHNLYLQIAAELGIPVLVAFTSMVGYLIAKGWQLRFHIQNHQEKLFFLGAWVGLMLMALHGLIDLTVWGTRMNIMPWFVMAFLLGKIMQILETEQVPKGDV